jgi:predicted DNA-binding transcriptional regulator AlpA
MTTLHNLVSRIRFSTDSTLLRRPQVEPRTGFRRATIYQRIQDGLFPRAIRYCLDACAAFISSLRAPARMFSKP